MGQEQEKKLLNLLFTKTLKKMSLYKELRPEIKELLDADMEEYPNLVKAVIKEMEGLAGPWVTDISVNTASQLLRYLDQTDLKPPHSDFVLKLYFIFGR